MEARRERWRRGIRRREAPASDWVGILAALGALFAYGYLLHVYTARMPLNGVAPRLGVQDAVVLHLNEIIKKEAALREAEEAKKETPALPAIASSSPSFSSSSSTHRTPAVSEDPSTPGVSPPKIPAASPTGIPTDQTTDKASTTRQDSPSPTTSVLVSSSTTGGTLAGYSTEMSVGSTPDAQKDQTTTEGPVSSTALVTGTQSTDGTSVPVGDESSTTHKLESSEKTTEQLTTSFTLSTVKDSLSSVANSVDATTGSLSTTTQSPATTSLSSQVAGWIQVLEPIKGARVFIKTNQNMENIPTDWLSATTVRVLVAARCSIDLTLKDLTKKHFVPPGEKDLTGINGFIMVSVNCAKVIP